MNWRKRTRKKTYINEHAKCFCDETMSKLVELFLNMQKILFLVINALDITLSFIWFISFSNPHAPFILQSISLILTSQMETMDHSFEIRGPAHMMFYSILCSDSEKKITENIQFYYRTLWMNEWMFVHLRNQSGSLLDPRDKTNYLLFLEILIIYKSRKCNII